MSETTTTTTTLRHGVTAALLSSRIGSVYALLAASALVYWPATVALVACWVEKGDRSYRHGFLILAACLWLIHRARERFSSCETQPSRVALALLVAASFAWVVFWRAAIQDFFLLLAPLILWLAIATAWGWKSARTLLFPIGFIYMAEPAWGSFAAPLQHITTVAVTAILHLIGITATRDGTTVSIPEGSFHIDLGCSGLHYFTVGVALAALAGELERATFRRRAVLIGSMIVLSMFCNWVRVATIVVAGHLTHMQHWLITRDHYWFGWCLFLVLVVAFVWVASRTEKPPVQDEPATQRSSARPALVEAFIGFSIIPLLAYATSTLSADAYDASRFEHVTQSTWSGPFETTAPDWQPRFVGADGEHRASFVDRSGRTVETYVASYRRQRQGAELVNYANSLTGDALSTSSSATVTVDGLSFVETGAVDAQGRRSLIWSRYEIGGRRFVVPLSSQLWYGISSLAGAPQSLLVATRTICERDCETARATLRSFELDSNEAGRRP